MGLPRWFANLLCGFCGSLILFVVLPLSARDKKDVVQYGQGLIVNVPAPEPDVIKAVEEVVQNGKIQGTKEYAKDEFVGGAIAASDSSVFPPWTEGGKVYYKLRLHAVDPRNFKESGDVGTLAVRYVVIKQDEAHTVLRIDAVFVEDFRHRAHASDGSVENAEYKDIHDHVESMELMKDQTVQAEREKQEASQKTLVTVSATPSASELPPDPPSAVETPVPAPLAASSSIEDLQKRVHELRQLTQRKVKATGASLKSAPFHTATTLKPLVPGAEVLIVISTPYWFGVETHDGQHGWILRDDLEELP